MVTRNQVLELALRGMSYEEIGLALGLSPGLAYLVATGVPADGSDALSPEDRERPGLLSTSTQHLSNPPARAPTSSETVHQWMKTMAASDTQMVAASKSRSTGTPSLEHPGAPTARSHEDTAPADEDDQPPPPDVLSVLASEHNEIHALLQELSSISGARDGGGSDELSRCESLAGQLVERLSAHEAAEERLFWPAVADTIDGGSSIAAMARRQEKDGKKVLAQLRRVGEDVERFDDLLGELSELVRKHVAFEDAVFAKVRDQLPEDTRRQLGGRLQDMLGRSPTRPHPHAPSDAAALHATAPAVTALDHHHDEARGRPADRRGRPAGKPAKGTTPR